MEIWEFPYGEIHREIARGGFLRFVHFSIGKCKGKPPEADLFEVLALPYRKMQRKTTEGGFFQIWAVPYREIQRKTTGGGIFQIWAYREI